MIVRFHLPEDQEKYKEQVLSILLQAALPQARAQLEALLREEAARTENESA